MPEKIKRIDIKAFREKGFLQEANRLFFHPLGLALEVIVDEDGTESLGGVWDYRNDEEGMTYDQEFIDRPDVKVKIDHVEALRRSKIVTRTKLFGDSIQKPG